MKFIHLSDLHIGKQFCHYNLKEEQQDILHKIVQIADRQQVDAVLIAGDIYDKPVPSAEAVSVFDEFLTELDELGKEVCLIAGNHDSAERIDYASTILARHRVHIAGIPPRNKNEFLRRVDLEDEYGKIHIYLLPFIKPFYVRNICRDSDSDKEMISYEEAVRTLIEREDADTTERNVIVAHQFFTAGGREPEQGDSELLMLGGIDKVDVSVLHPFDYAALGHIHRAQRIGADYYRYCGAPLAYGIKEADKQKTVTIAELREKGSEVRIEQIPLEPLRRITVLRDTLEHILQQAEQYRDDFTAVTLTDEEEPYHPKERLGEVYTHILNIQLDNSRTRQILNMESEVLKEAEPFEVFSNFFSGIQGRNMNEKEAAALLEMINETIGTGEAK